MVTAVVDSSSIVDGYVGKFPSDGNGVCRAVVRNCNHPLNPDMQLGIKQVALLLAISVSEEDCFGCACSRMSSIHRFAQTIIFLIFHRPPPPGAAQSRRRGRTRVSWDVSILRLSFACASQKARVCDM